MSNLKTHQSIDPAVEEVLASIRQIMAIDAEEAENHTQSEIISFPGLQPATSGKPTSENSDILNLTELIGADGSVTSVNDREVEMASKKDAEKTTMESAANSDSDPLELREEAEAFEAEETELQPENTETKISVSEMDVKMVSSDDIASLMSPEAVAQSTEAFNGLEQLTADMQKKIKAGTFGGQTVDELMREMLRPLLKEWLDSHLPSLVKWLVAEKIEQMIREKQGGSQKAD